VVRRGFCYPGTIVLCQVPYLTAILLQPVYYSKSLQTLAASTAPCGGFLNMLVFMLYRRKMQTAYGRLVRKIVDSVACYKPKQEAELVSTGRDLFLITVNETVNESHAVDVTEQ